MQVSKLMACQDYGERACKLGVSYRLVKKIGNGDYQTIYGIHPVYSFQ